ncbi:hypothetical protein ZYGR_0E00580 [Zygosaccharomyces rouxii]|uniref:ZYRO0B01364p n=2 Tax=Zygosaccharomyces rouxii TaxID=4956 RepID=C5DQL8_ZYGRC|nr:60S ribosomal protein L14 [Zygosaccharomyces rouxii]KAH9200369.1 60S ribosomal protein L14 [Zygosaccharomyces rouxii]GAV47047.1 hypothetical protein ZYGR_0E00580 [Zygosaccharomyces rouxii]CAR26079.1 ZYRO0B01364p [Zygosaccharomyces rouxii]
MSSESVVKTANWRLVEVGRIVLVKNGQGAGKLAAIVEIISQRKVLVDGPETGVDRQAISLTQVVLTPLTFNLPRGARSATVAKKWNAAQVSQKWSTTSWAKKIAQRETRSNLSDFERFQVMVLKKQQRFAEKKALAKA